jgi:nitroreductase
MNPTLDLLLKRKSVRAYTNQPISSETRAKLVEATLRAPTAGNMMLYSIIEVREQAIKDRLAVTCDNQPFIAKAPLVWLFLADYQRWYDYFIHCGVDQLCRDEKTPMRKPAEGDLFLACCDALIAAQNAVIAAEALGLGSCYIGDIMENYEAHRDLLDLPQYVFPITMLTFGYPTEQQQARQQTSRFAPQYIVHTDRYRRLDGPAFDDMYREQSQHLPPKAVNVGQAVYKRKYSSDFMAEMNRSVKAILENWRD